MGVPGTPIVNTGGNQHISEHTGKTFFVHNLGKGETVYALAKKYNVNVQEILALNGIKESDVKNLRVGRDIMIPSVKKASPKVVVSKQTNPFAGRYDNSRADKKIDIQTPAIDIDKKIQVMEKSKNFLRNAEGLISEARKEPSGDLSAGYGHKVLKEDNIQLGDKISKEKAEQLLNKDVDKAYTTLYRELGPETMKKLNEEQLSALTSYVFNIGSLKEKSPSCLEYLKKGEYDKAQAEIDVVKIKDKIRAGMIKRRMNEMLVFGKGKLSDESKAKLLKQVNSIYGTNYTSLKEAGLAKKKELTTLEAQREKTPSIELTKLRAQRELINLLIKA